MKRISIHDLRARADYLNRITGAPSDYLPGHYFIDHSNGGYMLCQICNESRGESSPLGEYRHSAREMYIAINAYIAGIER
jgi:hypothetical protein